MGGPASTAHPALPTLLTAPGAQEDEEPEESGREDEDSGSEESLVDSDSDPEDKGACVRACVLLGGAARGGAACHAGAEKLLRQRVSRPN